MLRAADLHRVFCADQTSGSYSNSSRIGTGCLSVLHGARLWRDLRSSEGEDTFNRSMTESSFLST